MKTYIYTVISNETESRPIMRSRFSILKLKIRKIFDLCIWKCFSKCIAKYYTWIDLSGSNQGDIAIRKALIEIFSERFADTHIEFVEVAWGELSDELLPSINTEGNLFVIGGSGYLHHDEHGIMNNRFKEDIFFLRKIKCQIVAFGIGMNRLLANKKNFELRCFPEQTISILKEFNTLVSYFSVRDEYSRDQLEKVDPTIKVQVIPDPALFLKPIEFKKVIISDSKINVGINFAFHGPFCQSILRKNLIMYIEFLKKIQNTGRFAFYYFCHSDSEKFICNALKLKGIHFEMVKTEPEKMLYIYKQMDVHISQMMHSSILSVNACVPTISLAYDVKNISFFRLIEQNHYCLNVLQLTVKELEQKFYELVENRKSIRNQLKQRKEALLVLLNSFMSNLFGGLDVE